MAVKIITMKIVSKKSEKAIEVSFPMDEDLFKASFSLPKKKRILFLTEAYREFKREEKRKRRLFSLESMLEDCTEFEDGLVDDSLNPEEQCLRNERDVLLYDAISKLNERKKVIVELSYNGKTQRQLTEEMGMTKQVYAHYDDMKKGTTLKALSSTLDNDKNDKKEMS